MSIGVLVTNWHKLAKGDAVSERADLSVGQCSSSKIAPLETSSLDEAHEK